MPLPRPRARIAACLALALSVALLLGGSAAPGRSGSAEAALKAVWGPTKLRDGRSAFPFYKRLGVDVLQYQLSWSATATARPAHPRDPRDPAYHWPADVNEAYAKARRNGIRLSLMVLRTPAWANGGRFDAWAPTRPSDYADFLVAANRRYPHVRLWQIWGEASRQENFQPLPKNEPTGPRVYARLLDRAYGALKRHDKRNVVIGGMTFTFGDVIAKDFMRWMRLPSGRPPRLDWFGHNPFTARRPVLSKKPYYPGLRDMSDMDTYIREIRRHWRPTGIRPRLWLSEFCVATDRANRGFAFHVSRATQAQWLTDALRISRRNGYIAGFGWWNLQDEPDPDGITCGLLDQNGRPKPSFDAFRRG